MADRRDFDEFVVTRSSRLLRTAFLLTRDWALAEDLLQTALAKSWFAWGRLDDDPEPYVRKVLVNTYASWWRRRWRGETPTESLPDVSVAPTPRVDDRDELWQALGRRAAPAGGGRAAVFRRPERGADRRRPGRLDRHRQEPDQQGLAGCGWIPTSLSTPS